MERAALLGTIAGGQALSPAHLDDRPKRPNSHRIQEAAERAFEDLVAKVDDLIIQGRDRSDYGTDVQVEVVDGEDVTNVRIHVQLKGTETAPNSDDSVSVSVRRATLNYLLVQPQSIFVCHHKPSSRLLVASVDAVVRRYGHDGRVWTDQDTVTVNFSEELTAEKLASLAHLARTSAISARNARFAQIAASTKDVASLLRTQSAPLHIPDGPADAAKLLQDLYLSYRSDAVISGAFDPFVAVLGPDHHALGYAYMSEINLGLAGMSSRPDRITEGIDFLKRRLGAGVIELSSLHYSIGNGYLALSRFAEGVEAFHRALDEESPAGAGRLHAEICKNLGTCHERLGDTAEAIRLFEEALLSNPHLPEAHSALGLHALQKGDFERAIAHFDQATFPSGETASRATISGWRVNALFNLGDGRAAFREISNLISEADDRPWIWPWCARQVAAFGRQSDDNATLSLPFWKQYLQANPHCPSGTREILLNQLYLRQGDGYRGPDYQTFRARFDAGIEFVPDEEAAYLWDRLGHWAQDEDDWSESERCFRRAYDLDGGHYGYCLGTALIFLDRSGEAVPLLEEQAEREQPDGLSWSQLGSAYARTGRTEEAEAAYKTAITLGAEGGNAWFELGGLYWNSGERANALLQWTEAIDRFPNHELAERLRTDFGEYFGEDPA